MLEANCGVASVSRRRLSLKLIKMKQSVCAWILRLPGHFELGFFASRIGRSEMEGVALGLFMYIVVNLEMDNSLKWVLFNIVRVHSVQTKCKQGMI